MFRRFVRFVIFVVINSQHETFTINALFKHIKVDFIFSLVILNLYLLHSWEVILIRFLLIFQLLLQLWKLLSKSTNFFINLFSLLSQLWILLNILLYHFSLLFCMVLILCVYFIDLLCKANYQLLIYLYFVLQKELCLC